MNIDGLEKIMGTEFLLIPHRETLVEIMDSSHLVTW